MIRKSVVFPHPDGPTRQTNSSSRISRSTPESACVAVPSSFWKALPRPCIETPLISGHLPCPPPEELPVHVVPEDAVDDEARKAKDQHVDDDVGHLVEVVVVPELVAEAVTRYAEHLGGHEAHPPDAHRDPDPGGYRRDGGGEGDVADQLKRGVAPEHLPRLDKDLRDVAEPGVGRGQDREEGSREDDEPRRLGGEPEPDDGEGNPGERRDGAEDLDDRVEEVVRHPEPSHDDPDGDAEEERRKEPDPEMFKAYCDIGEEGAGGEEVCEGAGDVGDAREDERSSYHVFGYDLPDHRRGNERCDAE